MEKTGQESVCHWHAKAGKTNTRVTLVSALRRARELNIGKILLPTCSGKTALEAQEIFEGKLQIIAVTHVTGYLKPDTQELSEDNRQLLESLGVRLLTAQHAFGGVGRGVRNKLGSYQIDEIIAFALRTFGQGTKVAIELALMAADAGLVRTDEDIVSLGGSASGVDTALVVKPANSYHFFELKVREVICKPAHF